jgi:membrane protein
VRDISPESPERRRNHPGAHPKVKGWWGRIGPGSESFEVIRRIVIGVFNDGFIHAGNLAYLSLLTLFPFFIVSAAIAQLIGPQLDIQSVVRVLLSALPPSVAKMIEGSVQQALVARTGPLLWFGAFVGLWTVTSFIETIRDILRRAYGATYVRPFWQYRLIGIAIILLSVVLMMVGLSAQILLTATEEVIVRFFPAALSYANWINGTRFVPLIAIYASIFMMFWTLAPGEYRARSYPKWPGAVFTTLWWYGAVTLLPRVLALFGGYTLTYGGLAGVIVALLFFWLVGYGVVIGAHINAALANPSQTGVRARSQYDEIVEAKWLDT